MNKPWIIEIANAIIWGIVLLGCAYALKGTGAYQDIQLILGGGAALSLIVVNAGMRRKQRN